MAHTVYAFVRLSSTADFFDFVFSQAISLLVSYPDPIIIRRTGQMSSSGERSFVNWGYNKRRPLIFIMLLNVQNFKNISKSCAAGICYSQVPSTILLHYFICQHGFIGLASTT